MREEKTGPVALETVKLCKVYGGGGFFSQHGFACAWLTFNQKWALQLQGGTDLELMYVECTSEGDLRGIARTREGAGSFENGFAAASAGALLAITLEPWQRGERYQGIVPHAGETLGEALEGYFAQSEQLPTRLLLAGDGEHAAGLLLQRLPDEGGHSQVDADGWNRVDHLLGTVGPDELVGTPNETLLHRLFHDGPSDQRILRLHRVGHELRPARHLLQERVCLRTRFVVQSYVKSPYPELTLETHRFIPGLYS